MLGKRVSRDRRSCGFLCESIFSAKKKNPELLLPTASYCASSGAIAKDQRRRLDEERLARLSFAQLMRHLALTDSVRDALASYGDSVSEVSMPDSTVRLRSSSQYPPAIFLMTFPQNLATTPFECSSFAVFKGPLLEADHGRPSPLVCTASKTACATFVRVAIICSIF